MDPTKIAEELDAFIRSHYGIADDDTDFGPDVHLFDYGYVDSFGAVELTTFVESNFGIEISNTDLVVHPLNSIREISQFVVDRQEGKL